MTHFLRTLAAGLFLLGLIASPIATQAQLQRQISYQGFLALPNGNPLSDGQYSLVLRMYDDAAAGNLVWEETQTATIAKGLFNVYLGAVVPLTNVDFSKQLYLEMAITGQPPFPRTQLAMVPYAIYADRAKSAGSLDSGATGFVRSLNGGQGDLVIRGTNGISVTRDGDTISIESTINVQGIASLTSPQATIDVTNPSGPNALIDVRDGAITSDKIADNAVTSPKIATGAVTNTKIANGAVTASKIAAGVIPTSLPPNGPAGGDLTGNYPNPIIAFNAVSTPKILDGAVTTNKISDNSVTTFKLADDAVSTAKVADGAITTNKLSSTGVAAGTYGDELNIPRITVDSKGRIATISVQPITNFPYIVGAGGDLQGTYPNPTIRANAITTGKILDGNVTTVKLADLSVTNIKIADNAINSQKVQDFTLTAQDLAPGTIPTTLPPSGPAGGDLAGTYPNPAIATGAVTSSKIAPMAGGLFVIGTGPATAPAVGGLVAGSGIAITYNSPNITIASSLANGTQNDQTMRWNTATSSWQANSNILASASGNLTVNGNTVLGDASGDAVAVNAATVTAPNLPTGTGSTFVMSNNGALETRTINNITTGTGTANRLTRWGAGNTLTDGSLDDNGNGQLTRTGSINITSNNSDVNIDGAFVVSGRDVFIGDAFGSNLYMREPGGNFNAKIFPDNLGNANREYIIPNSSVATTFFLVRDFGGTQTISNGLAIGGALSVTGTTFLGSSLTVSGASTLNSSLTVAGTATLQGNASVGGTLGVTGATTLANTLTVAGATNLGSSLTVSGASTLTGNTSIGGTLGVTGATTLSNTLTVAGATTLSSSLSVSGASVLSGNTSVGGALSVSGNTALNDNTTLGDASTDAVTVNAATVNVPNLPTGTSATFVTVTAGALQTRTINNVVSGTGTANRMTRWTSTNTIGNASLDDDGSGTLSFNGNIGINPGVGNTIVTNGSIDASGNATFGGNLFINGTSNLVGNVTAQGALAVSGNTTIGGTLGVTGATSLSNSLNVGGATTLAGLTAGASTLSSATVTNNASVGGDLAVTGNVTVAGNTTLGNASADAVTINAATVTAPNLPTGTGTTFVMSNAGALETKTINNIVTGTGSNGRLAMWNSTGTITNASLSDNGSGVLSYNGNIGLNPGSGNSVTTDGSIFASENATVGGTLSVTGATILTGNLTAINNASVLGNLSVSGTSSLTGNTTIAGTLGVAGATALTTLTTSGLATINSLAVTNNATVGGDLTVGSALLATDLSSLEVSIGGDLLVSGIVSTTGDVAVGNDLTTVGNATIGGTLDVTGSTTLTTLTTTGAATLNSATVTNNAAVGGDLAVSGNTTVAGNTTLGNAGADAVTINAATVTAPNLPTGTGTTFVMSGSGGALETKTINNIVTGTGTTNRMTRWTSSSTVGNASLSDDGSGTLSYNGNIGINPGVGNTIVTNGSINASGDGTFNGNMTVVGTSNLVGNVTAQGNLNVSGTATVTGNSTLGNVSIGGTLNVSPGATTLSTLSAGATSVSTLNTSGAATLNSATVTNNASVGGDLSVTGNATVSGATSLGNTSVAGTLTMTTFNTAGVVKNNASGVLSTGLVALTSDVAGVLPIANGGTGANTAPGARTNLGLGTIATQDANAVAITGGTIDGTAIGGTTAAAGSFTTLSASGNATVGGTLGVTGATTLAGLTAGSSTLSSATITNNATVGGTLGVTGVATFTVAPTVSAFNTAGVVKNNASGVLSTGQVSLATEVTGTLPLANGGTGSSTASGARTNLGLGTIATQDANSVAITGGTIDGTAIGGTTAAAGAFTTLSASGVASIAGTTTLSGLTASRPLKLNASKEIVSTQIDLAATNDVTGVLPVANGGTGLSAIGTANQYLRVNSGGTALEFGSLPTPIADGTTNNSTLRWSGTAWVENTNLTSTSTGNTTIGGTLGVTGNVSVNTNKFTVAAASGNTVIEGTLDAKSTTYLRNLTAGVGAELLVNQDHVLIEATGAASEYVKLDVGGSNDGSFSLLSQPDNTNSLDVEVRGGSGVVALGTAASLLPNDANIRVDATGASPVAIVSSTNGTNSSEVSITPTSITLNGGVHLNVVLTAAANPYTVASQDYVIIIENGSATTEVDLPVGTEGRVLMIKNESGVNVDVDPDAAESVDGAAVGAAYQLVTATSIKIIFSNGNWYIVSGL